MTIKILAIKEEQEVTITMKVRGEALQAVTKVLSLMAYLGGIGASRGIGVTPEEQEYKHLTAFMDGDGADKISDLKINGELVKPRGKLSKEEVRYEDVAKHSTFEEKEPVGTQYCGICTMYRPHGNNPKLGDCTAVEGTVKYGGWCRLFNRKKSK